MATSAQLAAIEAKRYENLTEEEKRILAESTKQDWDNYVMEKNSATAQPGHYYLTGSGMQQYTGWNGGSVTAADLMAATDDSLRYGYDVQLDPRNNGGARDAINDLLAKAGERANADAIAGIGDYETNRQSYLDQIGWTDYQSVFENLQKTGSLGLNSLDGMPIEQKYELGNPYYVRQEPVQLPSLTTWDKISPTWQTEETGDPNNVPDPMKQYQPQQMQPSQIPDLTPLPQYQAPQTTVPSVQAPDLSGLQNLLGQQATVNGYAGDLSALLQMPTAALNPEQSEYLKAMQGMTLPEYQAYISNLGDYAALPELQALDLSTLQALLQLPQTDAEVTPYEGDLNALLRTPEQQAAYLQQIRDLQTQYAMPEITPFSYDPNTDPAYQALLAQYTRAANQGMSDTLGQISARTGGLASSYAGSAAQQTYNDYMSQATNALPQLYQAAWGRWMDEQQLARSANADAYNRALDALDRQTAAEQADWERQAYVDSQNYNRYQDALNRQQAQQQAEWDRQAYVEGETYARQQAQQQQQLAQNQAEWERQAYLDELNYGRQMDAYNQQLAANQAEWERNAYLDELLYGRQLDEINRQTAAEQEAWERNAYLEGLNYERYLDELNRQTAAEQREWERQAYVDEQTYARQQDALDRQTAADQTEWERQAYAAEMAYKQQQDELQRQLAAEQLAWERQAYADEQAYARQQDELEWQYRNAQLAQQQQKATQPQVSPNYYSSTYQQMADAGINNTADAIDWLIQAGFSQNEREALAEQFTGMLSDKENGITRNAEDIAGMEPIRYNQVLSDISTKLNAGQMQLALEDVSRYWNNLNKSQQSAMKSALKRYGITIQ